MQQNQMHKVHKTFFIIHYSTTQSLPGFYSKMAKNSGKRIPCCWSTWSDETNYISFVPICAPSWVEFGKQVNRDSLLLVVRKAAKNRFLHQKSTRVARIALKEEPIESSWPILNDWVVELLLSNLNRSSTIGGCHRCTCNEYLLSNFLNVKCNSIKCIWCFLKWHLKETDERYFWSHLKVQKYYIADRTKADELELTCFGRTVVLMVAALTSHYIRDTPFSKNTGCLSWKNSSQFEETPMDLWTSPASSVFRSF